MKKVITIALFAAVFGLVGCAHKKPETTPVPSYSATTVKHKCKKARKHHGKLGVEKNSEDTAK
jgi:hypothetical protein